MGSLAAHPAAAGRASGSPVRSTSAGDGWHAHQVPWDTAHPYLDRASSLLEVPKGSTKGVKLRSALHA
jgi:hypothetical protein